MAGRKTTAGIGIWALALLLAIAAGSFATADAGTLRHLHIQKPDFDISDKYGENRLKWDSNSEFSSSMKFDTGKKAAIPARQFISVDTRAVEFVDTDSMATGIKSSDALRSPKKMYNTGGEEVYRTIKTELSTKTVSFESLTGTSISGSRSYYLKGVVFADFNNSGVKDPGEPGIPRLVVEIHHKDNDRLGWVTTDLHGYFDTKGYSGGILKKHEFVIPQSNDDYSSGYGNEVLAEYFTFVPAPQNAKLPELNLGFSPNLALIQEHLRSGALVSTGESGRIWHHKISQWTSPLIIEVGGENINAAEYLITRPEGLQGRFEKALAVLELNHDSGLGLGSDNPALVDLHDVLIEYGHFLLDNNDPENETAMRKLLRIYYLINGGSKESAH